jgi:hypothetical protein
LLFVCILTSRMDSGVVGFTTCGRPILYDCFQRDIRNLIRSLNFEWGPLFLCKNLRIFSSFKSFAKVKQDGSEMLAKSFTIEKWPPLIADNRGVSQFKFKYPVEAPAFNNDATICVHPSLAAQCNGVFPSSELLVQSDWTKKRIF